MRVLFLQTLYPLPSDSVVGETVVWEEEGEEEEVEEEEEEIKRRQAAAEGWAQ